MPVARPSPQLFFVAVTPPQTIARTDWKESSAGALS